MADVVGTTQLYLQNLVAREFAPHLRVTHFYVENVRTYQAAPTALRVSQAYLESVRSRQDAPTPPPGSGGSYQPLLLVCV